MSAVVTRATYILAIVIGAFLVASDAGAVGGVASSAGDPVTVLRARYAVAISPSQTTRWASIQVEKFPGAMAWLLPVRPGARIDEASDAWFEALELATAPRVLAGRCDTSSELPAIRMQGFADRVPTQRSLHDAVIEDTNALRAFARDWALELPVEVESRFEDLHTRGFSLAAFLYAGPAGGGFTRTVRITDDSFPAVPLFMTLGTKSPVEITAFLIGAARARLGAGPEIEIDPTSVRLAKDGSTNYPSVRAERLLAAAGESWVIEASESDLFTNGARRPGGVELTPAVVPTYDQRAASYGDSNSDPTLALHGQDSSKLWVTRAVGIVAQGGFGDDVAVTLAPGVSKSPFLVTMVDCNPAAMIPPPVMTVQPPPQLTKPAPSGVRHDPPSVQEPVYVETTVVDAPPPQPVEVSGSCDGSPQSQPQETSSDSSSDDSCDSSSDSSSNQSDDGCDSSSSSSSSDSGSSSDGCGSSSSSSSSSDCSVARRARRHRSRTSLFAWAICAVLLPLRRVTRKREC
jgi:hypothetical protein